MTFLGPLDLRKKSISQKFTNFNFIGQGRLERLKDDVENRRFNFHGLEKLDFVLNYPRNHQIKGAYDPWDIPENYGDDSEANNEMLRNIRADYQACVNYAIRYALYGSEDDAYNAARIIDAYAQIKEFKTNNGSTLNWYDGWTLLIQAALLIRESSAYTFRIDGDFRRTITLALDTLEPIAYARNNNWAAWGLAMEFAAAIFLGDRKRFDKAIRRWYFVFDSTVFSNYLVQNGGPADGQRKNNVAIYEIYRMGGTQGNGAYGLLYSAFHLDGMTVAAEWARLGGEWLFDHVSPDGSSLEGFWHEVAYMKRFGAPNLSEDFLEVQWYNTSNMETSGSYRFSGYYTNRVGAGFYVTQNLWPDEHADALMNGPITTLEIAPGQYPGYPNGAPSEVLPGYPILQDYYGMYAMELINADRPLYG